MVKNCRNQGKGLGLVVRAIAGVIPLGIASLHALPGNRVLAQVIPDGTLGTQVDGNLVITGGTTVGGANLFHSFSSFSVPNGQTALFNNVPNIVNIFGRVTGGTVSDIQGTIQALGTANLFLINPSGIIFGPNARLDIGGSFVGTTANAIRFADGGEFSMTSAVDPGGAVLRVNPSAFIFNQIPGPIVNQSIAPNLTDPNLKDGLRVRDGQSLFLIGGDVSLANGGTVRSLGGRIELGGLAQAGEVTIEAVTDGTNPNLNFPDVRLNFPDGLTRANVSLTTGAIVDVVAAGGGDIAINAQNINVSGESLVCAGIGTASSSCNTPSSTFGSDNPEAGNILLSATDTVSISQSSRIENDLNPGATGNADNIFNAVLNRADLFGSIVIETGSLFLTDGAQVSTSTFGTGSAGLVLVQARDSVSLAGKDTRMFSTVSSRATGDAGGILIETGSLSLTDTARINSSTAGTGTAGAVVVEADGAVSFVNSDIFSNVESGGIGNAGLIDIKAQSLSLIDGAQLQTLVRGASDDGTSAAGSGNAGDIKINVSDAVTISGVNNEGFPSAIFSTVDPGATGNAGNIQINARSVALSNSGRVDTSLGGVGVAGSIFINATDTVSLSNKARIETVIDENATQNTGSSNPFAGGVIDALSGRGGDVSGTILISTGSLSLKDGSVLNTSTRGNGNAGAVVVLARDDVSLKGGVILSTVTEQATGNAGAILMEVGSLSIASTPTYPAGLTTETDGVGNAGLILVLADKDISIRGEENGNEVGISSEASGDANTGGGIILGARSLFLRDGAKVSVDNQGSGVAGDIVIGVREDIILRDQGQIRAIANSGLGGNIYLTSGDFLVLVNRSRVSTEVGGGDGGDVTVNTRYIIGAPFNDNNINAFAELGTGGAIDITANRLYDIAERVDVLVSNDIDATARFGIDGIVTSNVLNTDPTQGLANLPANPVDPSTLIGEACAPRGGIAERQRNQFIVTGRGGLPPDPNAAFPGEAVVNDLGTPEEGEENTTGDPNSTKPTSAIPIATASPQKPEVIEAQGWVYGENGDIIFTARSSNTNLAPNNPSLTPASTCNVSSTLPQ